MSETLDNMKFIKMCFSKIKKSLDKWEELRICNILNIDITLKKYGFYK